jgi:hypothetical protein
MAFRRPTLNMYATTNPQKDQNISVFDKTKPDTDVTKAAINLISDLQSYSKVKSYWVRGHTDKRGPPFSLQEE